MTGEARATMQHPVDATHGRIFVYRSPGFEGAGLMPHLSLDGVDKGVLHVKRIFVFDVPVGRHRLEISGTRPGYPFPPTAVEVDVDPGQTLYYRYQANVVAMSSEGFLLMKHKTEWRYGLARVAPELGAAQISAMLK